MNIRTLMNYIRYWVLRISDGTVGAPAYSFYDENNTGFRRKSTGVIGLSLSGTERFEFSSTGLTGPTGTISSGDTKYLTGDKIYLQDYPYYGNKVITLFKDSHLVSASSWTKITSWDSNANANSDIGTYGVVSTARTTGDILIGLLAARFLITVTGYADYTGSGEVLFIEVRKNDTALAAPVSCRLDFLTNTTLPFCLSTVCDGAPGDTFSLYAYQSSSSRTLRNVHFTVQSLRT